MRFARGVIEVGFGRGIQISSKRPHRFPFVSRDLGREALNSYDCVICYDEKTSIQVRHRTRPITAPSTGLYGLVEHEYERRGSLAYMAAWDVRQAKIFGMCKATTGIASFHDLVDLVMRQAPYRSAPRVFWVTDKGIQNAGIVDRVGNSLDTADIQYEIFNGVLPDPPTATVGEALKAYKESKSDGIFAVGGGSSIDTAKGAAVVATNPGSIKDYEGAMKVKNAIPPLVCIPTITRALAVSENWFKRLPDDIKMVIAQAAHESQPIVREHDYLFQASCKKRMIAKGLKCFEPNDYKPFREVVRSMYPQFSDKIGKENIE